MATGAALDRSATSAGRPPNLAKVSTGPAAETTSPSSVPVSRACQVRSISAASRARLSSSLASRSWPAWSQAAASSCSWLAGRPGRRARRRPAAVVRMLARSSQRGPGSRRRRIDRSAGCRALQRAGDEPARSRTAIRAGTGRSARRASAAASSGTFGRSQVPVPTGGDGEAASRSQMARRRGGRAGAGRPQSTSTPASWDSTRQAGDAGAVAAEVARTELRRWRRRPAVENVRRPGPQAGARRRRPLQAGAPSRPAPR